MSGDVGGAGGLRDGSARRVGGCVAVVAEDDPAMLTIELQQAGGAVLVVDAHTGERSWLDATSGARLRTLGEIWSTQQPERRALVVARPRRPVCRMLGVVRETCLSCRGRPGPGCIT